MCIKYLPLDKLKYLILPAIYKMDFYHHPPFADRETGTRFSNFLKSQEW